ncbi:hypothetical protein BRC93_09240 [Halobacteriales archaeon QS_5_70_15]|nr:MAG: hypothetical protein BRC93_09240 [Halobacteriales archaeon QS_5_70_15]
MPRTVTGRPEASPRPDMSLIVYVVAAGSLLVPLPVLPVVAPVRLYDRIRPTDPEGEDVDVEHEPPATEPPEGASMA